MSKKIIVGISGGVDSSVTALLLKQQGYDVTGVFMKNWEEDDTDEFCSATKDIFDAKSVCEDIGIEFKSINFSAEYWDNVFQYFIMEYKAGRTPNPDILCNKEIKFKAFLEYVNFLGGDYLATGHYARKKFNEKTQIYELWKGIDENKDQSYFLCALNQKQLKQAMFPIGEMTKPDVRKIALDNNFITAKKKDSTGICFIGERKFKTFLEQYIPAKSGNIEDENGIIIGKHQGLMFHTIGQRQGLGIGGVKGRKDEAWYVAKKDLDRNVLVAVQGFEHEMLYKSTLIAKDMNWISGNVFGEEFNCKAKIRYRQEDQECTVTVTNNLLEVHFFEPQRAITPGQSLVLYNENVCLGGAVIVK